MTTPIRSPLMVATLAAVLLSLAAPAQAATVLSTVHYQKQISIPICAGVECAGNFPSVGANQRLNLTRMHCRLIGPGGSSFSDGTVMIRTAGDGLVISQFMSNVYSAPNGIHTIDQPVDLQVAATQHVAVNMHLVTGTANAAVCTATGTLDKLQQ